MNVSSATSAVTPSTARPAHEATEGPGPDHDGDHDAGGVAAATSGPPQSGQRAPGGGIYL